MAQKKLYTGYTSTPVTIAPYSVATLDYMDSKPNYFRVTNSGEGALLCSTTKIPTANSFDFSVAGGSNKMYVEPFNRTKLYIFNPNGSPINAVVLSFAADFDPLALALGDITVEMGDVTLGDIAIKAFNTSLPAGTNKIGKVDVNSLPALPAGTNNIGKVGVTSIPELPAGTNNIGKVNVETLPALPPGTNNIGKVELVTSNFARLSESTATETGVSYTPDSGKVISKIEFISNDGDENLTVSMEQTGLPAYTMTVKPGEVMYFACHSVGFTISGNNVPFRLCYLLEVSV